MPKFPTYERQQGLSGGATASFQSAGAFAAPAQALAQLGDSTADLGHSLNVVQRKVQNSQDDTWFSKARAETALEMQNAQNELRQQATDGAQGYTDNVKSRYEQVRQNYLKGAPSDRARQMFDEWSNSYSANVIGDAATFQAESTLSKRNDDFAKAMLAHSQVVLSDPSQYDAVAKRAADDLAGAAQWMTPDQELKARNAVMQELQLARAKAEIQRDPAKFLQEIGVGGAEQGGSGAVDAVVSKIIGAESGGNASAKNPNSSASGLGQFIDSTWLKTVKTYRPDVAAGKSDREILALKSDPALGREMTANYTKENAASLASAGLPATAGNLYLAHFLGPGGAKTVLGNGDDASLEGILSPGVISANSFLRGKSVGWIKNWAAKKMGGGSPNVTGNERFSGLDVGQVIGLQQQAESQVAAISRQEQAAATAQLAQIKGSLQLGIATGDTNITPHTILSSPLLDDDKAQLINSLNEKQGDARLAAGAMAKIDAGEGLDPFNADDKKGVSLAYDAATGGSSLFEEGNAQSVLGYMYGRSRILPTAAKNEIRAGLLSSDPARVAAAAGMASQLADVDRGGLEAAENGEALLKAATTYKHMTQNLGLTPEEAGKRMVDMADPEKARQREALLKSEPVESRIKDIDAGEVRDIFDPGLFGGDPDLGETPMAEAAMVGEYKAIFEDSIVDANGDEELAKQLASQRFSRTYGPSALTLAGDGVVTKLPPEKAYPPGPDGTHSYISQQLSEALAAEGIEADEAFLSYYDQTEADFRAGRPARYQVWYKKDGRLEMYNLPFFADPKATQADGIEKSRARRDDNRAEAAARQAFDELPPEEQRERSLDAFLDGPPKIGGE